MRLYFQRLADATMTTVRVGRTQAGWAAVTDRGVLLAVTPSRRATLALLPRLGLARAPGQPPPARIAVARGTPFQLKVWRACRGIPLGETLSYGELARRAGCRSARAVGQALGRNPLCRLIPCHRVTSRRGAGGFAWSGALKHRWLREEQAG